MAYADTIRLLEDLSSVVLVPAEQAGLARTETLLSALGNPHRTFRSVHVAGSSGKGSTTTMIGSILQACGYTIGFFRSPHLNSYTERIAVGERDIGEATWTALFREVWPIVEAMRDGRLPGYTLGRPAIFEVLFCMFALHLAQSDTQWAAVETGLGGRLDATNTLASDVAIISSISLEHTQVLGTSLTAIAQEKAAIIKSGCSAVTGRLPEEALAVVRRRARDVGAPLIESEQAVTMVSWAETSSGLSLHTVVDERPLHLNLCLHGTFQVYNAATALSAAIALRGRGITVPDPAVVHGLAAARVPGRMEVMRAQPLVILDGAHHPQALQELTGSLDALLGTRPLVVLFAAMKDKDVRAMAEVIGPRTTKVILSAAPGTSRSADPAALAPLFQPYVSDVLVVPDAHDALELALQSLDHGSALLVTGSMYLVGHVREALLHRD